jgi:actin-like ATPase involved in cell morphogenesis
VDDSALPAEVADNPQMCVARGTGIALENLDSYKRSIFSS